MFIYALYPHGDRAGAMGAIAPETGDAAKTDDTTTTSSTTGFSTGELLLIGGGVLALGVLVGVWAS